MMAHLNDAPESRLQEVRSPTRMAGWAWAAGSLAGLELVLGFAMAIVGSSEGWVGAFLYSLMYALPALLIALALGSRRPSLHRGAAWAALLLAVCYVLIVVGNWPGYSKQMTILAVGAAAPAVALYLAIFSAAVLRRSRSHHFPR